MNSRSRKTTLAIALAAVLALLAFAAVAQASTNKGTMTKGAKWIAKETKSSMRQFPTFGFRADAVSALAAARKSGGGIKKSADDALMANLHENAADYATTAGATSKLLLAAVAAGDRPECFGASTSGNIDLYGLLNSFYISSGSRKGQYGDTAFDQALAMLAVKAAHHKIPTAAVKFVKNHRGSNGWNFALSTSKGDDVESTGLMIEAMRAAGVSKNDRVRDPRGNRHGQEPEAVKSGASSAAEEARLVPQR